MRIRLILSFALIVLVSIALVVLVARYSTAGAVRAFMFRGGMTGTEGIVNALEDFYSTHHSWQGVEDLLAIPGHGAGWGPGGRMMGGQGMTHQRLRLADAQGNLVADTGSPQLDGTLSLGELNQGIALEVDGRTVGYLLPEGGMGFSRNDESQLVNRLSRAALTAGLIAGGFSLLLALFLAYHLLRPVRELTQAATRLGQGDLSQRVPVRGNDELASLGRTFNTMADSLQQSEKSRRAITADIAHELRNPLAVQRANLEALQDGIYPLTATNLQPVLEQNLLLTRLVEDLRTLALAESGKLQLEYSPTDLPALLTQVIERFRPQAEAQGIALSFTSSSAPKSPVLASNPPSISLDPMRIEQILGNLLSNALRYTPREGRIETGLEFTPQAVRITVRDSGPGIPPEAIAHIFERFYRADRSRSRAEGGSGLGLAIARQLAEAHGGTLTAENHPAGGALFTLRLPVRRETPLVKRDSRNVET